MNTHFTKNIVPKYFYIVVPKSRRDSRYDIEDLMILDSSPTSQQQRKRIFTYVKIGQKIQVDEHNSLGTAFVFIHGGVKKIVINPSTSPVTNTTVGGTYILSPAGGMHFKNKLSFMVELPYITKQLPSETKDISARLSSSAKSPFPLLKFVEQFFNQQREENLSPYVFSEYRDSQTTVPPNSVENSAVIQNNQLNSDISQNSDNNNNYDMNGNCIDIQCNNNAHDHIVDNKNKMSPTTQTKCIRIFAGFFTALLIKEFTKSIFI